MNALLKDNFYTILFLPVFSVCNLSCFFFLSCFFLHKRHDLLRTLKEFDPELFVFYFLFLISFSFPSQQHFTTTFREISGPKTDFKKNKNVCCYRRQICEKI